MNTSDLVRATVFNKAMDNLTSSFRRKLEAAGCYCKKFNGLFYDNAMKRQRRHGWYAWIEMDNGQEIGASIDFPMKFAEFTEEEIKELTDLMGDFFKSEFEVGYFTGPETKSVS